MLLCPVPRRAPRLTHHERQRKNGRDKSAMPSESEMRLSEGASPSVTNINS
jgi:hypothetical protein